MRAIRNSGYFSVACTRPPAIEAILGTPGKRVQGFLAAGHVCAVVGYEEYFPLAEKYHVPFVVMGFEPLDIMQGIYMTVRQLESGRAEVENQYVRCVQREGNRAAQQLVTDVFEVVPRKWRELGEIPSSGLGLRAAYTTFDAERRFDLQAYSAECLSGEVMRGLRKPFECPDFGTRCTPENPLGAPMVSSEGACAAWSCPGLVEAATFALQHSIQNYQDERKDGHE